jgi:hypothetical protein
MDRNYIPESVSECVDCLGLAQGRIKHSPLANTIINLQVVYKREILDWLINYYLPDKGSEV